jgi:Family of unknown function (DUF6159)
MSLVNIHCYGCARKLAVPDPPDRREVLRAGWSVSDGETYCSECALARGIASPTGPAGAGDAEPRPGESASLERFSDGKPPGGRTLRLLRASLSTLREDPRLIVYPTVGFLANMAIVGLFVAAALSGGGTPRHERGTFFLLGLVVAYPLTFVSLFCSVALAAALGARLEGRPASTSDGWRSARERVGVIAGWTLLSCSVGAVLRTIEQYVPLGGRIAAAILDLSWSLATLFAVPVLAYEGLGPRATFSRSATIFKARWGTQIAGSVGIGLGGLLLYLPAVVLVILGAAAGGAAGGGLLVIAVGAFLAAVAVQVTLGQIFRVFVYRSAVGLPVPGPFEPRDLQAPFSRRRGRRRR